MITVDGCASTIDVAEEGLPRRANWEQRNEKYTYTASGHSVRKSPSLTAYEATATGRLVVTIASGYATAGRQARWSDGKRRTIEDKLPERLREIELRGVEFRHRQLDAQRLAAERERAWETAMVRARERYAEHHRAEVLRDQVDRWHEARRIRAYCDAASTTYPNNSDTAEWVAWARDYADMIDALGSRPTTRRRLLRWCPPCRECIHTRGTQISTTSTAVSVVRLRSLYGRGGVAVC